MPDMMESSYKIVFEALETGSGIAKAIKDMAEGLDISIVIINPCGKIITECYRMPYQSEAKIHDQEGSSWCQMVEDYYEMELSGEECDKDAEVVENTAFGLRIMRPIVIKEILEGFCITYHHEHEEMEDASVQNRLICRAMAIGFGWKNQVYHLDGPSAKQVVGRLLLGKRENIDLLPKISERTYQMFAPEPFSMAVIKGLDGVCIRHLRGKVNERFPEALIYAEQKELVILFVSVNDQKLKEIGRYIDKFLKGQEYGCALSGIFDGKEHIKIKRKMLERVIGIGERIDASKKIYTEYEYYIELICSYAFDEIGSQGYCYRELKNLEREDKEKGTEFDRTLKQYLMSGNNVNLAAKEMYIHRNTMVYRLSKIHEMLGLEINDPDIARRLLLSMVLEEFASDGNLYNLL